MTSRRLAVSPLAATLLILAGQPAPAQTIGDRPLLTPINPPGPAIPGISQAMLIEGDRLLVLSGHVPLDAQGQVPAGLSSQLDQVLRNLDATLRAAGTDFSAVARLTIYVRGYEPSQLADIRKVRDRWVNADRPPASALIGVASLFRDDALVEVDALAVLPDR